MADIKLYKVDGPKPVELVGKFVSLEKNLQNRIEKHLDIFLGIKFLASEYILPGGRRSAADLEKAKPYLASTDGINQ